MKTKLLSLAVILSLFIISCSAIDNLLTFNISQETSFTINSGLPINLPFDVETPDVTTNSSSVFKNNNTKADLVKDVKLTELKLTITDPASQDFSFLKSVHLYISTDGRDEIELAYMDDVNSTANNLNLTCTGEKLDDYIKAPSYKIRTSITTKKMLNQNVTVKANMKFKVTADPL